MNLTCSECGSSFDVDPGSAWVCRCCNMPELRFTENQKTLRIVTAILNSEA